MQESALRRGLFVLIVGEALGGARFGIGNKGSRLFIFNDNSQSLFL